MKPLLNNFFIFIILGTVTAVSAQSSDASLPGLSLECGFKTIFADFSYRPMLGLTFPFAGNRLSINYHCDFPVNLSGAENSEPHLFDDRYHQFLDLKIKPFKKAVFLSGGVCLSQSGFLSSNWLGKNSGKYLLSASASFPIRWLNAEIRYNLLPNEWSREMVAGYSHLSLGLFYSFSK
jgi:hypothetical protein